MLPGRLERLEGALKLVRMVETDRSRVALKLARMALMRRMMAEALKLAAAWKLVPTAETRE